MEPMDVSLTATAMTAIGILSSGNKERPRTRSKVRFTHEATVRDFCSDRTLSVPLARGNSVSCCCINRKSCLTHQEESRRFPAKNIRINVSLKDRQYVVQRVSRLADGSRRGTSLFGGPETSEADGSLAKYQRTVSLSPCVIV